MKESLDARLARREREIRQSMDSQTEAWQARLRAGEPEGAAQREGGMSDRTEQDRALLVELEIADRFRGGGTLDGLAAAALARRSKDAEEVFDLRAHLQRQREFSERTFGPGTRTAGVIDHIRKELREIEADPSDITEWIDVVILALDGAWRAGYLPDQIIDALRTKQARNEARVWPDWRTANPDRAIEHVRPAAPTRETEAP